MKNVTGFPNLILNLFKCAKEGNFSGCKDVMSHIKDTDNWQTHYYDKSGDSIGILAARWGHTEILRYLHEEHGLALELSNLDGKRPLHEAAQFGHLDTVKYLVSKEVDVNCLKQADWYVPLHVVSVPVANVSVTVSTCHRLNHGLWFEFKLIFVII
jgi:hypothetical protein